MRPHANSYTSCAGLVSLINTGTVSLLIIADAWESGEAHYAYASCLLGGGLINHRLGWVLITLHAWGSMSWHAHTSCEGIEW